MKVILTKESEYDFSESKYTAIPSGVFEMLVETKIASSNTEYPKVIVFNDKDDYVENSWRHNINKSKDVYVSQKGQIFCFIDDGNAVNNVEDGATDTEENN